MILLFLPIPLENEVNRRPWIRHLRAFCCLFLRNRQLPLYTALVGRFVRLSTYSQPTSLYRKCRNSSAIDAECNRNGALKMVELKRASSQPWIIARLGKVLISLRVLRQNRPSNLQARATQEDLVGKAGVSHHLRLLHRHCRCCDVASLSGPSGPG